MQDVYNEYSLINKTITMHCLHYLQPFYDPAKTQIKPIKVFRYTNGVRVTAYYV